MQWLRAKHRMRAVAPLRRAALARQRREAESCDRSCHTSLRRPRPPLRAGPIVSIGRGTGTTGARSGAGIGLRCASGCRRWLRPKMAASQDGGDCFDPRWLRAKTGATASVALAAAREPIESRSRLRPDWVTATVQVANLARTSRSRVAKNVACTVVANLG